MKEKAQIKDEHQVFETPEEQILHRPGMWLGSTKSTLRNIAILESDQFVEKELEIIPAVAKLVEEIIVNSADEHIESLDPNKRGWLLDQIKIKFDESGKLEVWDNGGITSQLHSTGMYPVEVIFGKLFSSSNYDDTKKRNKVGTNGVGASLANLFSKSFKVTSADGIKEISVEWFDNKSRKSDAIVKDTKEHYTLIKAQLDLERFDIETVPFGITKYVERLSMILAASNPGLTVEFNGEEFKFKNFREYINLYGHTENVLGETTEDWEIYITPAYGDPKRYAIVNGAECNEGTHVKHLDAMISRRIQKILDKLKLTSITPFMVKNEYSFWINMQVDKPQYSSQAKTELTNEMTIVKNDGTKDFIRITEKLTKELQSSFIIKNLQLLHDEKSNSLNSKEIQKRARELNKMSSKTIKKLLDANGKTKAERAQCELWIFEGESAGSGFRSNRAQKTQGCYFLKGKCVNSINMKTINVLNNQEFSDIIVALGLDPRNPSDLSKLRFKKIIVSTDADVDGHSIVGQLFTLFAIHFPELINAGLIYRALSPVYKASKGADDRYFYRVEDFKVFNESNKGWKIKYFKGLGSLQKADYKAMISDSKLERYSLHESCIEIVHAFMGSDSKPRKRLLESEV